MKFSRVGKGILRSGVFKRIRKCVCVGGGGESRRER